jgi:hypothetical protein
MHRRLAIDLAIVYEVFCRQVGDFRGVRWRDDGNLHKYFLLPWVIRMCNVLKNYFFLPVLPV